MGSNIGGGRPLRARTHEGRGLTHSEHHATSGKRTCGNVYPGPRVCLKDFARDGRKVLNSFVAGRWEEGAGIREDGKSPGKSRLGRLVSLIAFSTGHPFLVDRTHLNVAGMQHFASTLAACLDQERNPRLKRAGTKRLEESRPDLTISDSTLCAMNRLGSIESLGETLKSGLVRHGHVARKILDPVPVHPAWGKGFSADGFWWHLLGQWEPEEKKFRV